MDAQNIIPVAHCVYAHCHPDEDVCFYGGSGSMESARPWRGESWRSEKWQAYVSRLSFYRVQIVSVTVTEAEARERERQVRSPLTLKPVLGFNPVYVGRSPA